MILSHNAFTLAASPELVILRSSDEDDRWIPTSSVAAEFSSLRGCKLEGNS
jgi:hypothetical protein